MQLKNKVAIVTGGARGIGAGIAQCLVAEGALVALVDMDGAAAEAMAAELNNGAIGFAADVSEEDQMAEATAKAVAHFGGLDIFVNNAGGGKPGSGIGNPFTRISQGAWDEQLITNLVGKIGENIRVRRFVRFVTGEGLEKRSTDLKGEVEGMLGGQ